MCHETIRFFNITLHGPGNCQPPWPIAPDWMVSHMMHEATIIVDNPEIAPEELHTRWCEACRADGWTHGDLDPEAKTMPSLIPWAEINESARAFERVRLAVAQFVIVNYELGGGAPAGVQ